jgi:hypothetical protein
MQMEEVKQQTQHAVAKSSQRVVIELVGGMEE